MSNNQNYKQSESTHIYYNMRINTDLTNKNPAVFNVNRVQPILDRPSDYEIAVVRYSLPITSVPLIVFQENRWALSLKIGSSEYTEFLQWIPNTDVFDFKYIYIVQDLLDMMNVALNTAFTNLSGAHTITSTKPPFFSFSSITNLITLHVPQSYLADGISVYSNSALYYRMNTFQDYYENYAEDSPLNYKFVIQDLFDNNVTYDGVPYYTSTQQYATIGSMSDLKGILFETTSIPVSRQLDGAQKNITQNLLTDFEPQQSNKWYGGGLLQYFPQGPIRFIDLLSTHPLNRIDLVIKWTSKSGETYPFYLQGEQSATIKIMFRKKTNLQLKEFIDEQIDEKLKQINMV